MSWSQYKLFLSVDDQEKREFYIAETIRNNWTVRQLERQIYSSLYERLLLSNDKESVLAVARNEKLPSDAKEIIKDPMFFGVFGLEKRSILLRFTLPEDEKHIIANQYELYLPTEQQLLEEVNKELESFKGKGDP